MGIDNVDILKGGNFNIRVYDDGYGVSFSDGDIEKFESFVSKNLKAGFWNEYLGKDKVFIFKFEDEKIKKFVLNDENESKILELCRKFANYSFPSLDSMLKDNIFYAETYYSNN